MVRISPVATLFEIHNLEGHTEPHSAQWQPVFVESHLHFLYWRMLLSNQTGILLVQNQILQGLSKLSLGVLIPKFRYVFLTLINNAPTLRPPPTRYRGIP